MLWVPVSKFLVEAHPFGPHFAPFWPQWPLLGHKAFKWSPGGKFHKSGPGASQPIPVHLKCVWDQNECFGVPVSMFLVEAHPFGPHFAPFWPRLPLLGHVAFKRSRGGKIFTSRVLGPPNPFQCI